MTPILLTYIIVGVIAWIGAVVCMIISHEQNHHSDLDFEGYTMLGLIGLLFGFVWPLAFPFVAVVSSARGLIALARKLSSPKEGMTKAGG